MAKSLRFARSSLASPLRLDVEETEKRPAVLINQDSPRTPTEIVQIIKEVGAREQRLSVKHMRIRPRSRSQPDLKTCENAHQEIHKIIKEIGTHEHKQKDLVRPISSSSSSSSSLDITPRERSRHRANTSGEKTLSRRSSLSFLGRTKSVAIPKDLPAIPELPKVIIAAVTPEATLELKVDVKTRQKRSASAPTPPSNDLLIPDAEMETMPNLQPSRPNLKNTTPRMRSPSLGQYSLFPKTTPSPSPRTSPTFQPRAFVPRILQPEAKDEKSNATLIKADSPEACILDRDAKPSLQIPPREEQAVPAAEMEPKSSTERGSPSRPLSSHSSSSRRCSKRVAFSEIPSVITTTTTSSESSTEQLPNLLQRHSSCNSMLLGSAEYKVQFPPKPPLSRQTSLPVSPRTPLRTKSILRRTSSFQTLDSPTTSEEKQIPETHIVESPMMVKNLKRLPRKNSRKTDPLPQPTTPTISKSSAYPQVSKYARHSLIPMSMPISPPFSTTSSSYSNSSSSFSDAGSARSSTTSTKSSLTYEDVVFRTVSEPIRYSNEKTPETPKYTHKSKPSLIPTPCVSSSMTVGARRELAPMTATSKHLSDGTEGLGEKEQWKGERKEGKWLRRGSYHAGLGKDAPPVPAVPKSVVA